MPLFSSAPDSLCILRLSAIGDVCNTVAAVQSIQRQWPTTQITWITGKLEAQLINDLNGIEVIVFDKKQGWEGYKSLWKTLKGRKFDALLHMQYAFRASIATLGIKAKYKLGFDSVRSQDFQTLFTNVKVPSPSETHVLDGLLAFCETLGIKDISPSWSIPYSDSDKEWAKQHISTSTRTLVLVPAASKAYKNWNAEGYADVIHHAQSLGWNIILAGSPAKIEIDLANQVEESLTHSHSREGGNLEKISENIGLDPCLRRDDEGVAGSDEGTTGSDARGVLNLVGKSSLKQMLALLDLVDLVIAPDTGPAHMANAVNTPVLGLYAHHNPQRTGPYQYRDYVVSAYEEAIKIETGKTPEQLSWRARVKDKQAMNLIKSQDVISMFDRITADFSLNNTTINTEVSQ
ncbi:glycosyltransferase family 9 protein [Vibrio hannami]|uniref:glycosyltransferase family 9 protein n=1 Tax=Vibrio hannami TaxID=2717094 RepID=UPI00240FCB53|nr:glycosyltransferase family 9 protein [Vibrio hannami]MDG3086912.1 glycosyltransferase family 9 protein [Vibrio hannami]